MAEGETADATLPTPFYDDPWPRARLPAAQALWHWHTSLTTPQTPALDGDDLAAFFKAEYNRAAAGEAVTVVPAAVREAAYGACEAHRLPRPLLAEQIVGAAERLGAVRFETSEHLNAFMRQWAIPHGRLLAHLAGAGLRAQYPYVDELARAFFLVQVLVNLPADLEADRLFIPLADLEKAGVTVEQLRAGRIDEPMRKLLWKQVIRARDAFAQGQPLVRDLARRYRSALKRWWLGGLEVLNEIQRRRYDVWDEPITLSAFHRVQIRFQALFGRTSFKPRR